MSRSEQQRYAPARERGPGRATRPAWTSGSLAWLMAGVAVLAGLFLAGLAAQNFGRADESTGRAQNAGKPPPAGATRTPRPAGLGDPVRDGKFEFVVSRVDCRKSTVSSRLLTTTAKGKFCVVSLSVRNVGDQSRIFSGPAQKAYDAAGAEFGNDALADFYANDNSQTFLKRIVPGDQVTGKVVFDVPRSTRLAVVELHDSFLSDGVRITLARQ